MRTRTSIALVLLSALFAAAQTDPQTEPTLDDLQKASQAAYRKGDYAAARASLEQAWTAVQQSELGDPRRFEIAKQLVAVLSAAGEYKAAQEYEEIAINWRETTIGLRDPKIAEEWIELSILCQRLKDFPRALALLERARGIHMQSNGAESLPVADDWSRIALMHSAESRLDLAVQPLQMAIRIREAVLGAEHPAILAELDRLASAQITLRRYADAEASFRRSLVIRERLTGPMSADLIASVEGLAYAQFGQLEYEDAEKGYKRLLALWIFSTQQLDHPMVAMTYDKLATFYRAQKRWEEAEAAAGKSLALKALFLSAGLQREAAEQLIREKPLDAVRLLQRALDVLDPAREEHAKAREQLEASLKETGAGSVTGGEAHAGEDADD